MSTKAYPVVRASTDRVLPRNCEYELTSGTVTRRRDPVSPPITACKSRPSTGSSPCPSRYAMRLSIAVIAMANLPSMRLVSWNTELTVGVTLTSIPFFANSPFSCAIQIGQLKPPGKTMRLTVLGGAGCAIAQEAISSAISPGISFREIPFMFSSIDGLLLRIAVRQVVPHALGDAPLPGGAVFRLLLGHARRLVGQAGVERGELHPRCVLQKDRERHRPLRRLGPGDRAVHVHHDCRRLAHRFGHPDGGGVVADQARIGPERHLRIEMRTLAVSRLGREAQRRERHHVGRDEAADRLDLAAALVDLLVHPDFAEDALGQRRVGRHHRARLARLDDAHGLGRAHEKGRLVQAHAAMPERGHESGAGERPRHFAHDDLLLLHLRWKVRTPGLPLQAVTQATVFSGGFLSFWSARNSGMSGREPHMQNDSGANGNCRGRELDASAGRMCVTPTEYS